ncbi:MAG: HAD family phosphatase [Candidatus Parvarchaeota archaeon]|nr:HAD family phosphatase [Candidatus Jingweiarchaeum tengchongense]MCW1297817.1 HAD family phosphatase [Candidatus Jingweiarchaeum tengchongense]MCW1299827.1 HAD family phosphatase [Candidatus Jingweiarchaeum tengchongense]MCW1304202.1 HAD family phosphatase [Candidatus Jingweiarchaeum tengchongense]MCW1305230.1 HAD family phosphatase [Candidatus Jingweiarchaeum tengchongense]
MRKIRLIVFDLEGILTKNSSSWFTLNKKFGISEEEDKKYFNMYMANKITYKKWAEIIIKIWIKNAKPKKTHLLNFFKKVMLQLNPGVRKTIHELKKRGYKIVVISGSLDVSINIKKILGVDEVIHGSKAIFDQRGNLIGVDVNSDFHRKDFVGKFKSLIKICKKFNIKLDECAAIGDSWNDYLLFKKCAFSIAFNSNDARLKKVADVIINKNNLSEILQYFPKISK